MVRVGTTTITVVTGDLTRQNVDAIVNAANEYLAHGGGVAAAIVRAGGQVIQKESDAWIKANGPVASGHAAVTNAGAMPATSVVHVVGPRYRSGQDNEALLRTAVRAALDAAVDTGARSIALPAISSGIFGYPRADATAVIASQVVDWAREHESALEEIRLVGYDQATASEFEKGLAPAVG
ncbi:MAG: macro domain-containing protein [Acidimicrobiia bacterium]